jgi:hypothetical protein
VGVEDAQAFEQEGQRPRERDEAAGNGRGQRNFVKANVATRKRTADFRRAQAEGLKRLQTVNKNPIKSVHNQK